MQADMATIVLKNVPAEMRRKLEERARASGRSVGDEVVAALEGLLGSPPRSEREVDALIADARAFRGTLEHRLSDREISRLKKRGRP